MRLCLCGAIFSSEPAWLPNNLLHIARVFASYLSPHPYISFLPHTPGKEIVGEVSVLQVYELARLKQKDDALQHVPVESIARSIVGTCRSMGIAVVNLKEREAQEAVDRLNKKKAEASRKEEILHLW